MRMTCIQIIIVLRENFPLEICVENINFVILSSCIVFIWMFREEEESEEDEEMENQENSDTDAKKPVEGTTQDYPMARCVNLYTCLGTMCLCNVCILLSS